MPVTFVSPKETSYNLTGRSIDQFDKLVAERRELTKKCAAKKGKDR
jgi:hypothetical protein